MTFEKLKIDKERTISKFTILTKIKCLLKVRRVSYALLWVKRYC